MKSIYFLFAVLRDFVSLLSYNVGSNNTNEKWTKPPLVQVFTPVSRSQNEKFP